MSHTDCKGSGCASHSAHRVSLLTLVYAEATSIPYHLHLSALLHRSINHHTLPPPLIIPYVADSPGDILTHISPLYTSSKGMKGNGIVGGCVERGRDGVGDISRGRPWSFSPCNITPTTKMSTIYRKKPDALVPGAG